MSSATNRASSRPPRRGTSTDEVVLRDLAAIDFETVPLLTFADDDVRRRWERIALGDHA